MGRGRSQKLKRAILLRFGAVAAGAAAVFYLAGRDYWQGQIYFAVLFVPLVFVLSYFMRKDPEFLERRMRYQEKEKEQRAIVSVGLIVYFAGFAAIAADRYYSWSQVPVWAVLAADAFSLAGYGLVFLAFRENAWASRIIEVMAGQKLVSTGPYAAIRHPMYLGSLMMTIAMPLALGTLYPVPIFALYVLVIGFRIRAEEKTLRESLAGYNEYCEKVKYRLLPGIW